MTRTTARLGNLAAAHLAAALVLTGCVEDRTDAAGHDAMMGSAPADSSAGSAAQDSRDDADVAFAREMVPHHRQAIAMARLAEDRAADPRVRDLAARIEAAQDPEIDTLTGWLAGWGAGGGHMADGGTGGVDHGGGGMMSGQDMHALMTATGREFDRLFLTGMIEHHRGAVRMAEGEIADGRHPGAIALAESIRDGQSAEIAEMEQLLTELGD